MKAGRGQPMSDRYRSLEPVIRQTFALQQMTRITVGPQEWVKFTPQQQQQAIAAFARFITANYAYNFREYDGERFDVDSNPRSRGDDKLVQTHIIGRDGTSTSLLYRMRQSDGNWKVLDVYSEGVSELTLRRSDFSAAIASGGAPELLSYLQKASDGLMRR
jgi:phospholipid transport system substrate-binding protein